MNFIGTILEWISIEVGFWVALGIVGLVFIFMLIAMLAKKRALPIGRTTALTALVAAFTFEFFMTQKTISGPNALLDTYAMLLEILLIGGALALIGGFISTVFFKKKKKCCCKKEHTEQEHDDASAFHPVSDNDFSPAEYSPAQFSQPANNYPVSYAPMPADTEKLLAKIDKICADGGSLSEMRETAVLLQKERAKPENKQNPEVYGKLNKALIELLNAIQKR